MNKGLALIKKLSFSGGFSTINDKPLTTPADHQALFF
jgi:hypothetical protein